MDQLDMKMCGSLETDVRLKEDEKPKMSFSTADYVDEWGDFPKGLKVLLLDDDDIAAAEIKSRLEEMDYIVSLFHNEDEAIEAVANKTETFHVAIVEVNTCKSQERFRFLQMARGLPTIMVSNVHCLSTMMKCIALGAAEFLQKPLSEDKLRNIWQHVVHKALSAGPNSPSRSLKPIKETVASMLHLESDAGPYSETENEQTPSEASDGDEDQDNEHGDQVGSDRFPAPSTPQLEQGERLSDGGDCQDQANSPIDCAEEERLNSVGDTKSTDGCFASGESSHSKCGGERSAPIHRRAAGSKSNKRKTMRASKVDWSPELHRRFVQAVEQLGIDRAIPSKILELMKVQGLTRHNVASHLQKYRMHRRHASPKDEEGRRCPQHGDSRVRRPSSLVAYPPPPAAAAAAAAAGYSVWGQPTCHFSGGIQPWARSGHQAWQRSPGIWPWKTFSRMHADAWGCPVVHQGNPFPTQVHRNLPPNYFFDVHEVQSRATRNTYDLHVAEEVIDKAVKEGISKPWLPLPLGLKTPSTDTVLAELQRQGIRNIPFTPRSCR